MSSEKYTEPIEAEVIEPEMSGKQNESDEKQEPKEGDKRQKYPTFGELAAIFGVLVVSQLLFFLILSPLVPHIFVSVSDIFDQGLLLMLVQILSMSTTIAFIGFTRRSRKAPKAPLKLSTRGFNPIILLGGLLMILATSVVIEPILSLLPAPPSLTARGWPILLSVVVFAPIFEEVICRGMIYESLRAKGGVVSAWLISSLFFGIIHLDPASAVNAFFMGLILCYIYIRSQSIFAPIILHAINNGLSYLCIVLNLGGDESDVVVLRDIITSDSVYYAVYGVAVVIFIASVVICTRQFNKIIDENKVGKNQSKEVEKKAEV